MTDAGYERGIRDAIAAVGEVERTSAYPGGPMNLIPYDEAQRHIARLSSQDIEDLWDKPEDPNMGPTGGIVPPYITDRLGRHRADQE
jgi:hypothetical protein